MGHGNGLDRVRPRAEMASRKSSIRVLTAFTDYGHYMDEIRSASNGASPAQRAGGTPGEYRPRKERVDFTRISRILRNYSEALGWYLSSLSSPPPRGFFSNPPTVMSR